MAFPTTLDELRQQGYVYQSTMKCRGCQAVIEFWWTPAPKQNPLLDQPPRKKLTPLDIDGQGKVMPHFATCPKAAEFRRC